MEENEELVELENEDIDNDEEVEEESGMSNGAAFGLGILGTLLIGGAVYGVKKLNGWWKARKEAKQQTLAVVDTVEADETEEKDDVEED